MIRQLNFNDYARFPASSGFDWGNALRKSIACNLLAKEIDLGLKAGRRGDEFIMDWADPILVSRGKDFLQINQVFKSLSTQVDAFGFFRNQFQFR